MSNILYIGTENKESTAYHRFEALKRLGHEVTLMDVGKMLSKELKAKLSGFVHYRTGYFLLQGKVNRLLTENLSASIKYDFVWIDSGELFGPKSIDTLKQILKCPVILYNIDDPTGKRDGSRFRSLIKALPSYDLVAVVRSITAQECRSYGAKKVIEVSRSYDEIAHKPFSSTDDIPEQFRSDVAFIGTWMPKENRDHFLLELIRLAVPLSIWGNRWERSDNYHEISSSIKGQAIYGRDYVAATQGAKLCIGMLSKGNRDLHTTRSLEIPFIGGLFCAQRTSEHMAMFKDGVEAVFWDNPEECARLCHELLNDDLKRESIRTAGMKRVREMQVGNEDICKLILNVAGN